MENQRSTNEEPSGENYRAWCSFCRKNYRDAGPLVEGPNQVYICYECCLQCETLLRNEGNDGRQRRAAPPDFGRGSSSVCTFPRCTNNAVAHVQTIRKRRLMEEAQYCGVHVETVMAEYYALEHVPAGTPRDKSGAVECDVELVLHDCREAGHTGCQICVREKGGKRRIDVVTSPLGSWALQQAIRRAKAVRPLPHTAMATLITVLGGRLERVKIDRCFRDQQPYAAKLHIRQMNIDLSVDVPASDAIILAVTCSVPIFVSDDVLSGLAKEK